MPSHRTLRSFLLLASLSLAVGCSDVPTQPEIWSGDFVAAAGQGRAGKAFRNASDLARSNPVEVVERAVPLLRDEVVSEVIGPLGGKIHLQKAGLMVKFPAGALDRDVRITVTAPAGNLVGYEFQPHGLVFNEGVKVQQDFRALNVHRRALNQNRLFAAYFQGPLTSTVNALETLEFDGEGGDPTSFMIWHFSGYVIATD